MLPNDAVDDVNEDEPLSFVVDSVKRLSSIGVLVPAAPATPVASTSASAAAPECSCSTAAIPGVSLAFPGWLCPAAGGTNVPLTITSHTCVDQYPTLQPQPTASVPTALRVAFLTPPVTGMDDLMPHFSWVPPQVRCVIVFAMMRVLHIMRMTGSDQLVSRR